MDYWTRILKEENCVGRTESQRRTTSSSVWIDVQACREVTWTNDAARARVSSDWITHGLGSPRHGCGGLDLYAIPDMESRSGTALRTAGIRRSRTKAMEFERQPLALQ